MEDSELRKLMLNSTNWEEVDDIIELLQPFLDITEFLSGEKYISISSILPILFNIKDYILVTNDGDSDFLKELKDSVKT